MYINNIHFFLKKLFDIRFNGDLERLRKNIKLELEEIFEEELKIKKIQDAYKNWNGYIDTKSERDDKLKNLGV